MWCAGVEKTVSGRTSFPTSTDSESSAPPTTHDAELIMCGFFFFFFFFFVLARYFPSHMKEHLSHDVVLLCTPCHQTCSYHDGKFKRYLAEEYGAPISGGQSRKFFDDPALLKAKNYAK